MELARLTERAMQLRRRFTEAEQARQGRAWTREELMQGFVVDVGDLMKLVMAKAGARPVDDVDLEKEFLATMTELEAKLAQR